VILSTRIHSCGMLVVTQESKTMILPTLITIHLRIVRVDSVFFFFFGGPLIFCLLWASDFLLACVVQLVEGDILVTHCMYI